MRMPVSEIPFDCSHRQMEHQLTLSKTLQLYLFVKTHFQHFKMNKQQNIHSSVRWTLDPSECQNSCSFSTSCQHATFHQLVT